MVRTKAVFGVVLLTTGVAGDGPVAIGSDCSDLGDATGHYNIFQHGNRRSDGEWNHNRTFSDDKVISVPSVVNPLKELAVLYLPGGPTPNWAAANEACGKWGGHLASIESWEEMAQIENQLVGRASGRCSGTDCATFTMDGSMHESSQTAAAEWLWIGLKKETAETWSSGYGGTWRDGQGNALADQTGFRYWKGVSHYPFRFTGDPSDTSSRTPIQSASDCAVLTPDFGWDHLAWITAACDLGTAGVSPVPLCSRERKPLVWHPLANSGGQRFIAFNDSWNTWLGHSLECLAQGGDGLFQPRTDTAQNTADDFNLMAQMMTNAGIAQTATGQFDVWHAMIAYKGSSTSANTFVARDGRGCRYDNGMQYNSATSDDRMKFFSPEPNGINGSNSVIMAAYTKAGSWGLNDLEGYFGMRGFCYKALATTTTTTTTAPVVWMANPRAPWREFARLPDASVDHATAEAKCKQLGAVLPVVYNEAEAYWLMHTGLGNYTWLGLRRYAPDGDSFKYHDPDGNEYINQSTYRAWGGSEPSNSGGIENRAYFGIHIANNALHWNDTPHTGVARTLCMKEAAHGFLEVPKLDVRPSMGATAKAEMSLGNPAGGGATKMVPKTYMYAGKFQTVWTSR